MTLEKTTRSIQVPQTEPCIRCSECGRNFDDTEFGKQLAENHVAAEHVEKPIDSTGNYIYVSESMLLKSKHYKRINVNGYETRIYWTGEGWYSLTEEYDSSTSDHYDRVEDLIERAKDKITDGANALKILKYEKKRLANERDQRLAGK